MAFTSIDVLWFNDNGAGNTAPQNFRATLGGAGTGDIPAGTYYFKVVALCNNHASGSWSATLASSDASAELMVVCGPNDSIQLDWDILYDSDGNAAGWYNLYCTSTSGNYEGDTRVASTSVSYNATVNTNTLSPVYSRLPQSGSLSYSWYSPTNTVGMETPLPYGQEKGYGAICIRGIEGSGDEEDLYDYLVAMGCSRYVYYDGLTFLLHGIVNFDSDLVADYSVTINSKILFFISQPYAVFRLRGAGTGTQEFIVGDLVNEVGVSGGVISQLAWSLSGQFYNGVAHFYNVHFMLLTIKDLGIEPLMYGGRSNTPDLRFYDATVVNCVFDGAVRPYQDMSDLKVIREGSYCFYMGSGAPTIRRAEAWAVGNNYYGCCIFVIYDELTFIDSNFYAYTQGDGEHVSVYYASPARHLTCIGCNFYNTERVKEANNYPVVFWNQAGASDSTITLKIEFNCKVLDSSENPISDVSVVVTDSSGNETLINDTTDANGNLLNGTTAITRAIATKDGDGYHVYDTTWTSKLPFKVTYSKSGYETQVFSFNLEKSYTHHVKMFLSNVYPAESLVDNGQVYGPQGSGYTGSMINTDPGEANVLVDVEYTIKSVAKIGTYDPPESTDPGESNVKKDVAYIIDDIAKTGTLESIDPGEGNVKKNISYKIESSDKTGTLESTDPGEANVLSGTSYKIESIEKVGTLISVTETINVDISIPDLSLSTEISDSPAVAVKVANLLILTEISDSSVVAANVGDISIDIEVE